MTLRLLLKRIWVRFHPPKYHLAPLRPCPVCGWLGPEGWECWGPEDAPHPMAQCGQDARNGRVYRWD